jgi:uncharacterized small protein (DUF1192 family)
MAYADTLKVFGILREKFEEEESSVIAKAIENALEENNDTLLQKVATKEDIAALKVEIANLKAELIKWMFLFWIGQIAVVFGIVKFVR